MKELDLNQAVVAMFVLCSDVSKLTVHGIPYVYFRPRCRGYSQVIQYIFKKNNIYSELHRSHYYNMGETKNLVVRTPVSDLSENTEFKNVFNSIYADKNEYCLVSLSNSEPSACLFKLWPGYRKLKFINEMANKVK